MTIEHEDDDEDATSVTSRAALNDALSKLKQQRPWIVIVSGVGGAGRMYCLENELVVGRGQDTDVRIDGDGISRHHAKLIRTTEGAVVIVDLDSRNGTFVNGAKTSRQALKDGDKIQIGAATILKFSYQDALDEELQKNLFESATRDALTQLANKRTFTETLTREVAFARRHFRPLSIAIFDVDHFKKVNDTYGHPAGDYVLKNLARVVTSVLRREDLVARIGGEEFAMLLRDSSETQALACAERVRAAVAREELVFDAKRIPVTISVGVCTSSSNAPEESDGLVAIADRRLYLAKRGGRNRVVAVDAPSTSDSAA